MARVTASVMEREQLAFEVGIDSLDFVVGFYLGQDETSLVAIDLRVEDGKENLFPIEIDGLSSFSTALVYHPRKGILIGDSAIAINGVTQSYPFLQQQFAQDSTHQQVLLDYVQYIYEQVKASTYGITDENTLFVVSYPTDWMNQPELVADYKAVFHQAGIQHPRLVPEYLGDLALLDQENSFQSGIDHSDQGVFIIHLRESATDLTWVDLDSRSVMQFQSISNLGADLLSQLILEHILNNTEHSADLIAQFRASSVTYNRCKVACRRARERHFENPNELVSVHIDIVEDLAFSGRFSGETASTIIHRSLTSLQQIAEFETQSLSSFSGGGWSEEFDLALQTSYDIFDKGSEFLKKLRNVCLSSDNSCGSVIKFAKSFALNKCQNVRFTSISNTSKGLAHWGWNYVKSRTLIQEIKLALDNHLLKSIEKHLPDLFRRLSMTLLDYIATNVVKPDNVKKWMEIKSLSRSFIKSNSELEQEIRSDIEQMKIQKEIKAEIYSELNKFLSKVERTVYQEHLMAILSHYNISSLPFNQDYNPDGNTIDTIFKLTISSFIYRICMPIKTHLFVMSMSFSVAEYLYKNEYTYIYIIRSLREHEHEIVDEMCNSFASSRVSLNICRDVQEILYGELDSLHVYILE